MTILKTTSLQKIKLIAFDWDGTLADSVPKIIQCKNVLAQKYQLPFPSDILVRSVLGMSFGKAMTLCFPTANATILKQLSADYHLLMQQDNYQATLFPNVITVINQLKLQGVKLAIATSKSRSQILKALDFNNLATEFDLVCSGEDYIHGKPHPEMLNDILANCEMTPHQCLMIGDTLHDIEFAYNAGVQSIAVTFGAHFFTEEDSIKPTVLIRQWSDLFVAIDQLTMGI